MWREFSNDPTICAWKSKFGGKQTLLGISKRGSSYLRRLFVQDARAIMMRRTKQPSGLNICLENSLCTSAITSLSSR